MRKAAPEVGAAWYGAGATETGCAGCHPGVVAT
ncbi:CxxxxCH/CxxCH domain-containing protein [Streptomyces bacillaris]